MEKILEMNTETCVACFFIFLGALVMLASIFRFRKNIEAAAAIPKQHHQRIALFLALHQALMGFFFCCYIVVLLLFAVKAEAVGELFVGIVFLLGALFVLTGISIQHRLLSEIQKTICGLLPICSICKKIQIENPDGSKCWKSIEAFFSRRSAVDFSHGLCPDCLQNELETLHRKKNPSAT